jgi:hypothetical protein
MDQTKSIVRALRDGCYGHCISDSEWETAGPNWERENEVLFLLGHQGRGIRILDLDKKTVHHLNPDQK